MGCWNGTCLISNLPIYEGDEVVFFILKRRWLKDSTFSFKLDDVEDGHHYTNEIYEPLFYPVVGEYNDYGCIENVKEDISLIEKYFEDIELDAKDWEKEYDVFRNVERGNYKGYTFAMIHKDIYDSMIEHYSNRTEWWCKGKTVKEFMVEEIKEKINLYFEKKQSWKNVEGFSEDSLSFLCRVDNFICGKDSNDYFISKYLETLDEKLFNKLLETHIIQNILNHCRKFWFPQTGCGSQDDETSLYEILAKKMIEKCEKRNSDYEEYEDD